MSTQTAAQDTSHLSTANGTKRTVLEGVPRIMFYEGGIRCPEDLIFPSTLRAWLEYMQDQNFGCKHCLALAPECKTTCTYSFLVGVSGIAAFLSWGADWQGDNPAIHYMSAMPDGPYRRALDAIGYRWEWVLKETGRDNTERFRSQIRQSIDAGRPVIGFGVIGPPEPALITGYDDDGDTLIGWSFFQNIPDFNRGVGFEPSGYFRKRDWFKDTECLVVLGERTALPDLKTTILSALKWMVDVAGQPSAYPARANGLDAYKAWASDVGRDDQFPPDSEAILRLRHQVHNDAIGMVAEARWYGALFLMQAIDYVHWNMTEDVLHAAACFTAEHALMWKLWDLAGGNGNPDAYKFMADPALRRRMSDVILQSRSKYSDAIDHIKHALTLVA
ncbi:MAG TPA: hypothetical protein VGK87_06070 [Anaerolineae bacterium]